MRFSAITALCAAPLALASTLQADLAARGAIGVEVSDSSEGSSRDSSRNSNNNYNSNDYNNDDHHNSGNNIIEESTTIDEVIIIWVNEGGGAATSTVTNTVTVTDGGSTAALATHSVTVGGSAGLVYSPDTIEAAVGDMVIFTFESQNHTVTQSAFTTPCEALAGGKDSGFMANLNNTVSPAPQMAMQVTVATPIWFYCQQKGHCGKGMTFSINPTANKTQAMFQQMAIAQNGTGTAAPITGGSAPPPPANTVGSSSSAGSTGLTQGSGSINSGGSCECSCLCGVSAFPSADVQGIGGYGGMSGAMPMSALES